MLGYVTEEGAGRADALMAGVAARLAARGWTLAGAVQHNLGQASDGRCHMDLQILDSDEIVRISQDLGPHAKGCRLDTGALETAVGLAEAGLAKAPRLVIVNKFGKQEIDGKGFRPLIGRALAEDVPVICAVGKTHIDGFRAFAGEFASSVAPDEDAILAWVDAVVPTQV